MIILFLEDLEIHRRGLCHALLEKALDTRVARNEIHRTSVECRRLAPSAEVRGEARCRLAHLWGHWKLLELELAVSHRLVQDPRLPRLPVLAFFGAKVGL